MSAKFLASIRLRRHLRHQVGELPAFFRLKKEHRGRVYTEHETELYFSLSANTDDDRPLFWATRKGVSQQFLTNEARLSYRGDSVQCFDQSRRIG
jgi:hypothetical protein